MVAAMAASARRRATDETRRVEWAGKGKVGESVTPFPPARDGQRRGVAEDCCNNVTVVERGYPDFERRQDGARSLLSGATSERRMGLDQSEDAREDRVTREHRPDSIQDTVVSIVRKPAKYEEEARDLD